MSWFSRGQREEKEKVKAESVIDKRLAQRLDQVAGRLESVTTQLEAKVARMRKEYDER